MLRDTWKDRIRHISIGATGGNFRLAPIDFSIRVDRSSPKGSPIDFSIRVDPSIEPLGISDRLFDSSRSIERALRDPRSTFRFESIDRALWNPRKEVEVGSHMRQPLWGPSLFDNFWWGSSHPGYPSGYRSGCRVGVSDRPERLCAESGSVCAVTQDSQTVD